MNRLHTLHEPIKDKTTVRAKLSLSEELKVVYHSKGLGLLCSLPCD